MPLLLYEEPNAHSPQDSNGRAVAWTVCWVPSADERRAAVDKGCDASETRPREQRRRGTFHRERVTPTGHRRVCNLSTTELRQGDCKFKASLSFRYIEFRSAWLSITYLAVKL